MATPQPVRVWSQPGIKRDSTQLEGENYSDGLWCRFNARALPRKIAGYQALTQRLDEVVRGMDSFTADLINYIYMGSRSFMTQFQQNLSGAPGAQFNRTPGGFAVDVNNLWQFTQMQNLVTGNTVLVAHAAPNLNDIAATTERPIYYGDATAPTALVASGMDPVSGGVVAAAPYILAYGNGGRVDISVANDPTQPTANSTFVTQQKIVKGLPIRNSTGPAVILWSLDSVITGFFDPAATAAAGGIATFDWNTVSASSSIMSSQCVIEYDSIYYWVGADRFLMFNGIQRELPNNLNIDFFFKNLNFAQRQKVFAIKVPRWGEIWWCFPRGNATECNHAVIYNTRLQTWYDTPLPDGGRTAGLFAKVYQFPYMCDADLTPTGFTLWQHETGMDKVVGTSALPIPASITTHEQSPVIMQQGAVDKAYRVGIIEPDFLQVGNITCTVLGRANARVAPVASAPLTIVPAPVIAAADQMVELKKNARLLAFQFSTNTIGGDFEMGHVLAHIEQTDGRFTQ